MVGLPYDCVANPHGAVRLTFEKAVAASQDADSVAALCGKDWGAVDLFRMFLFEEDGLSKVPILNKSSLPWIKPNTLVRFRGMVQDMLGNELYIGAFKDGSTWRTNKFTDVACRPIPSSCQSFLWERRLFVCVPVPGQNSWILDAAPQVVLNSYDKDDASQHGEKRMRDASHDAMELNVLDEMDSSCSKKQREDEHIFQSCQSLVGEAVLQGGMLENRNNLGESSFSCLVKAYDLPESHLKLNDVFEFIGIYTFDPELVHMSSTDDSSFDLMEDVSNQLPPNKVPRLHCLVSRKLAVQDFLSGSLALQPLPNVMSDIRESLLVHLSALLGNDTVAAQFLLLHLLSRVRHTMDVIAVGKLSLNLTGFNRESASVFGNQLNDIIMELFPFSKVIPLSVEYLNNAVLQPRKDNQSGRLVTGVLQLAEGTHLTIDETHLQAGVLNSVGVENARLLKNLMEWQTVQYDFEYYKIEMAADIQMLIFSEGKSNILPADMILPFRPESFVRVKKASTEELQAWRWYLATVKSLHYSNGPQVQQMLEDEIVAAMREDRSLGYKDLERVLIMAQLLSASLGERSVSLEQWQKAKELEKLRKERLR
ncbi:mini-chromosome maintenance complex-binding protein [Dendrobium catenatum]|uniref:Mini-chromosome maintenance complex-binding protein n=1 Tax=Dendrobium catenatum TaxID=906689 RepID=A0A2I0VFQ9_9ASPA|nr:mini-chromosome maintenance complex-binding protein [Dendrobium catenatum]PKU62213.1 Mini-chromosome maintenance complex-binding protein [Dendrobium catenatum]